MRSISSSVTVSAVRSYSFVVLGDAWPAICCACTYVETVARFARYFDRSPERLGPEQIRAYQVYLATERRLATSSLLVAVSALRFLYRVTLQKRWSFDDVLPAPTKPQSLPVVLSPQEVVQFLDAVKAPKHRAILTTCYAAGLRISEAIALTVSAIDSERMVLRITKGKGQKDRYVILSPKLLGVLRDWWKVERPRHWLFPGERPEAPITRRAVQLACRIARQRARLTKPVRHVIFAMPSRSICSRPAPTCAPSSSCSGIGVCRPRRATCGSRPRRSARPPVRWTCSRGPYQNAPSPSTERGPCRAPRSRWRKVFRRYGDVFRAEVGAALSAAQRRVMTAIEQCRTAALGGHVEQCDHCGHRRVWYNSCRNRHCPNCQSLARAEWLERRRADLLPTEYFHVVFTVPPAVAEIAAQNKAVVYGLLFRAVADTLRTIAADPRHFGAEIGFFAVLHTWGQTLVHHPHLHCVIPGGGLATDGSAWVACRPGFLPAGPDPVPLLPSGAPRGAARRLRVRATALHRPAAAPQ